MKLARSKFQYIIGKYVNFELIICKILDPIELMTVEITITVLS